MSVLRFVFSKRALGSLLVIALYDPPALLEALSFSPFLWCSPQETVPQKLEQNYKVICTQSIACLERCCVKYSKKVVPTQLMDVSIAVVGSERVYTSYIASVNILSNMDLKPRAPVFFTIALLAIRRKAFSVKCNLT